METGVFTYVGVIVAGLIAGVVGALIGSSGIWRTCRSLKLRLTDLEAAHLSLRNKGFAQKRWADKDQLEVELGKLMETSPRSSGRQRFDNDPPEF